MGRSILLGIFICWSLGLMAQNNEPDTLDTRQQKRQFRKEKATGWNMRLSPYIWLPSIVGDIPTPPEPSTLPEPPPPYFDLNLSFEELRASLQFAMIINGEWRSKRWMGTFTYNALVLDGQAITTGDVFFQESSFDLDWHAGEITVGYRALMNEKLNLDAFVGSRLSYFNVGVNTFLFGQAELSYQRKTFYYDLMIGGRIKYIPHYRVEFTAYGDMAPFQTGLRFGWKASVLATITVTKHFFISPGYMWLSYDPKEEDARIINGKFRGFYLKLGVQFL